MSFREHLRPRARLVAFVAAFGLGSAVSRGKPPPRTVEGLAALLSASAAGRVRAADLEWEAPRGFVAEALLGRRLLFLAAVGEGGARDVFRARVRLSLEGQPLEVLGLRNLTSTPLGDDAALDLRGHVAAFATTAAGRVLGVTALDLGGAPDSRRPRTLAGRLLSRVAAFQRTGTFAGMDEAHVVFGAAPRAARVALEPPRLRLTLEDPDSELDLDLARAVPGEIDGGALFVTRDESRRRLLPWASDLSRALLGAPGDAVRHAVRGGADLARRAVGLLLRVSARYRASPAHASPVPAEGAPGAAFPPADLPRLFESPRPGEGHWVTLTAPWLPGLAGAPEPSRSYFATTFLRPDPQRPSSDVVLVAIDVRFLELGIAGGYETPPPAEGPPGEGRLPGGDLERSRVVAVMNGGGAGRGYGLRVRGRDLVPPSGDATTLMVMDDGSLGIGALARAPGGIVSLRQGPDALSPDGPDAVTSRSALCRLRAGGLVYAWGRAVSGQALSVALRAAGCTRAVGLATGAHASGFALLHPEGTDPGKAHFALARDDMPEDPPRYLTGSEGDFLYLRLREARPPSSGEWKWGVSAGPQPEPSWLPGVFETRRPAGELDVRVWSFESGRVDWVLRAGSGEPGVAGSRSKRTELEGELARDAIAAIGLGHTTDALRYGLAFQGEASMELRQTYATLVLGPSRPPRILPPGERPALLADEDAVQLPLLADRGEIDPRGADRGSLRIRGAACVTPGGRFLVATARHDSSDPLASALLDAGCVRVVALDRGSRHPARVDRPDASARLEPSSEETRLFAVSRPMVPRTFDL